MPADDVPAAPTNDVPAAPTADVPTVSTEDATGTLHIATTTNTRPAGVLHFKLPTFSTVDAAVWFRCAEVQFRLQRVRSSHTQADHILAAIPDMIFTQMSTWLDTKGDDAIEYQDLKAFLLQKFSPSAERRVQMILDLSNQPLGDQRPSDALIEIRSLCRLPPDNTGASTKIDVLLALWLRHLPLPVYSAITNFASYGDDDLAKHADSLLDAHAASNPPAITAAASTVPPDEDDVDDNHTNNAIAAASTA